MIKATLSIMVVLAVSLMFSAKTQKQLPDRFVHRESGIAFVLIPAGQFRMGSPENEPDRGRGERQHLRIIRQPFYISETEVTVAQFRKFVKATNYLTDGERGVEEGGHTKGAFATLSEGDTDREWNENASWRNPFPNLKDYKMRDDHPVVQVSWNDARRFVEHYGLQLPTEAQWEYASRAGSSTAYFWGDAEAGGLGYGNVKDASAKNRFANWTRLVSFDDGVAMLARVGSFKPNAWKVRDAVGNVTEWCEDTFQREYPPDGTDETAIATGTGRVMRGGSWLDAPDSHRLAKRFGFAPQGRRDFIGIRVVMKATR